MVHDLNDDGKEFMIIVNNEEEILDVEITDRSLKNQVDIVCFCNF
jgi:hypothetical protein